MPFKISLSSRPSQLASPSRRSNGGVTLSSTHQHRTAWLYCSSWPVLCPLEAQSCGVLKVLSWDSYYSRGFLRPYVGVKYTLLARMHWRGIVRLCDAREHYISSIYIYKGSTARIGQSLPSTDNTALMRAMDTPMADFIQSA